MTRYLLTVLLLLSCACSPVTRPTASPPPCPDVLHGQNLWYVAETTLKLRHDGILRIGDTTIPLSGFMVLDTDKRKAKVVILTGLGIKLTALEVGETTKTLLENSPAARNIPHFQRMATLSIRRMFLTDFPLATDYCTRDGDSFLFSGARRRGTLNCRVDRERDFMTHKTFVSGEENWTVEYAGAVSLEGMTLPERILFTDGKGKYSVILQLKEARRQ